MCQKYSYNLVKKLYLNSEPLREFTFGQFVYVENDKATSFFVIKDGQFKLSKDYYESDLRDPDDEEELISPLLKNDKTSPKKLRPPGSSEIFTAEVPIDLVIPSNPA